jgi:hypothetical protein
VEWGGDCISEDCRDGHGYALQVSPEPTTFEFAWSDLEQAGWGTPILFNPREIHDMNWSITPRFSADLAEGAEFSICIDDLTFY